MSTRSEVVTPALLRQWPLPEPTGSKHGRGRVLIVGGAAKTPGAAMLAGLAALRVGAGHLQLAVAGSAAVPVAVSLLEAGVVGLAENAQGSVRGTSAQQLEDQLSTSDAVLVGAGLDDADETAKLLSELTPLVGEQATLVLDAFALGVLVDLADVRKAFAGRWVLTPNQDEAGRLLGRECDDLSQDVLEIADRYQAVVTCRGFVADHEGQAWEIAAGHAGLATSGSGDVLAGCVTGLLARGATPAQAACWATHLHSSAGDRLAGRVGPLGFLGRELLDELPPLLLELAH